ncbi:MAG: hypothetical protein M5R40_03375 [Anaerolineae bacterium]|nr:hypothetical protein [Anaerolineae bacterium]
MNARKALSGRLPAWLLRALFGAGFFTLGEVMLWDNPDPAQWPLRAVGCLLLAAVAVDLIVRFNVRDVPGIMVVGGVFGVPYGVLVAQVVGEDLIRGMVLRPLGWYALVGGALGVAAALIALRGAGYTLPRGVAAAGLGLLWGMWVRWFPTQTAGGAPAPLEAATLAAGAGLAVMGVLAYAYQRRPARLEIDLMLTPWEWALVAVGLGAFLVAGLARGGILPLGLGALVALSVFLVGVLLFSRERYRRSALRDLTPPARFNAPHYTALALSFLVAGGLGYIIPPIGAAAEPLQLSAMVALLYVLGFAWVPVVSVFMAVRAFMDISRQEG